MAAVHGFVYRRTVKRPGGQSVKVGAYRARYTDAQGDLIDRVIILPNGLKTRDKATAESELVKIKKRVERRAAGLIDQEVENAGLSMRVVLAGFAKWQKVKAGRKHVRQVIQQAKWCIENGPIDKLADFNERGIDRALHRLIDRNKSVATINAYRCSLHSIGEWAMGVANLTTRNPVAKVKRLNARKATKRKTRRALTVEEAYRLLDVAPPSRRIVYALWLWTGLRADRETGGLEWRDVVGLEDPRPAINVRAEIAKNSQAAQIPLHPDLAVLLRDHKPRFARPTDKVFKAVPLLNTFRGHWYPKRGQDAGEKVWAPGDLGRAGIPIRDESDRTIDRHALRTTFATWLADAGVPEKKRMALTRHAETDIAGKHYTDRSHFDLWAEIQKLPPIPKAKKVESEELLATGTDGKCLSAGSLRVGVDGGRPQSRKNGAKKTPNQLMKCSPIGSLENGFSDKVSRNGGISDTTRHRQGSRGFRENHAFSAGKSANLGRDRGDAVSDPESDVLPIAPHPIEPVITTGSGALVKSARAAGAAWHP